MTLNSLPTMGVRRPNATSIPVRLCLYSPTADFRPARLDRGFEPFREPLVGVTVFVMTAASVVGAVR